jgi:hypothetical protein
MRPDEAVGGDLKDADGAVSAWLAASRCVAVVLGVSTVIGTLRRYARVIRR